MVASTLLLAATAAGARAQVVVNTFETHVRASRDSVSATFEVRNTSAAIQQVRVFLQDWERDSLGNNKFADYGTLRGSCGERVTVFPPTLQLAAGGADVIRVTYRGGDDPDALEGCWAIAMTEVVRSNESRATPTRQAVQIQMLQGVKFYVHPVTPTRAGAVEYAAVEEFWEPTPAPRAAADSTPRDSAFVRQIAVRFANTGSDHLTLRTAIEYRDANAQLVSRSELPAAYITPDGFRDLIARLPNLPKGRYSALVLLDIGTDEVQAAQVEFEVP